MKTNKNIHILTTDKPSRLFYNVGGALLFKNYENNNGVNIYITSDEEIKEGDWMYYKHFGEDITCKYDTTGGQNTNVNEHKDFYKKIILTTDQDLIKDGIQAIDDEFLDWFVKNPNCEFVEVYEVEGKLFAEPTIPQEESKQIKCYCGHTITCDCEPLEECKQELELKDFDNADILDVLNMGNVEYLGNGDIIYNPNLFFVKRGDKWFIKTEKPKQETVEELAKEFYSDENQLMERIAFKRGYTECEERMYSEEEVIQLLQKALTHQDDREIGDLVTAQGELRPPNFYSWFEKFKKR